ncbi:uncharacterized protein [Drosophila suzukii]|uniref:Uncharacterized protein n=1 Tax=Drosophila suzukii TaxID=28584 RepID=A0ABM4TXC6_DROSZ
MRGRSPHEGRIADLCPGGPVPSPQLVGLQVVKDRKIIGVIDQIDEDGRIPRNQWGLVRRALASVTLRVLNENPGSPSDCTDAGWYQGNAKLIACEDERSAALYKAAINKVGEVYPGPSWQLARLQTSRLDRDRGYGWKVVKVEKTVRVTMNVVILLNQACLGPIAAQQIQLNNGFDKVQLRIYDTDKLAADNMDACVSYEHPSDDEMEHESSMETRILGQLAY